MTKLALLLFDVNGVLYEYDRAARVNCLAETAGMPPAAVDQAIWGSGFEDRSDAGGMSAEGYLSAFSRHLGYPLTVDQWTEALAASVSPIPAALSLARRAGQQASLGVLTNNNLLVRDRIDLLFPELRAIFGDSIYVSAQFGLRKPDPEIYRRALAWLGAAPGESLFIDDSAANVAGAVQAGLHGHHHTDAAGLEERLTELGLLS